MIRMKNIQISQLYIPFTQRLLIEKFHNYLLISIMLIFPFSLFNRQKCFEKHHNKQRQTINSPIMQKRTKIQCTKKLQIRLDLISLHLFQELLKLIMYKKSQDIQLSGSKKLDANKNSLYFIHKNIENMKINAKEITKKGQEFDLPPLARARHYLYSQCIKENTSNDFKQSQFGPNLKANEQIYEDTIPQNKTIKENKIIDTFSMSIKFKKRPELQKQRKGKHCVPTICQVSPHTNQQTPLLQELNYYKMNKSEIQQSRRFEKLFQATTFRYSEDKKKRKTHSLQKMAKNQLVRKQPQQKKATQRIIPPINIDFQFDQKHLLARKNSSNQQLLQNLQAQTLEPISSYKQSPKSFKRYWGNHEIVNSVTLDFENPEERMQRKKKNQLQRKQKLNELNIKSRSIPKNKDLSTQFLSSRYNFNFDRKQYFQQYFAMVKESIQQSINKRNEKITKDQYNINHSLQQYPQQKQLISQKNQQDSPKITATKQKNNIIHNKSLEKKHKRNYKEWNTNDYTPWDAKDFSPLDQFNINENFNN